MLRKCARDIRSIRSGGLEWPMGSGWLGHWASPWGRWAMLPWNRSRLASISLPSIDFHEHTDIQLIGQSQAWTPDRLWRIEPTDPTVHRWRVSQCPILERPGACRNASMRPTSTCRPAAATAGAAAQPAAVMAVLDRLLANVAASVRPALERELEDARPGSGAGGRPARIRREAEALLVAAERAATPAFRQSHAELWPALAAELDRRLTEACYASIYGENSWDDDYSVLWGRVRAAFFTYLSQLCFGRLFFQSAVNGACLTHGCLDTYAPYIAG